MGEDRSATETTGTDMNPWEVFDLNARAPEGWEFASAHGVNDEGIILVHGYRRMENGTWEPRAALLLPFELVDTKDGVFDDQAPQGTTITDAMRDVNIEPKKDANDTNIKSVAWIEPHGADDGSNEPDMPQLALRLRGTEQMGLKIRWD